jgi:hypothetical protein
MGRKFAPSRLENINSGQAYTVNSDRGYEDIPADMRKEVYPDRPIPNTAEEKRQLFEQKKSAVFEALIKLQNKSSSSEFWPLLKQQFSDMQNLRSFLFTLVYQKAISRELKKEAGKKPYYVYSINRSKE